MAAAVIRRLKVVLVPRRIAALLTAAVLIPALAACGSNSGSTKGLGGKTASGFAAVSVSGSVGEAPKVDWKAQMTVSKAQTKTLVQGTGPVVAAGDSAAGFIYLGNGYTKAKAYSDYDQDKPEVLTADSKSLSPVFASLLTGAKIGSRVATVVPAAKVFPGGAGNAQLGIGNDDAVLVIVDLVASGTPTDVAADKLPKLVEKKGKPSGFNFAGITKPDQNGELLRTTLKQGKGAPVTADETVTVNYLGEVFQGAKPFDQSYVDVPKTATTPARKAAPASFPLNQVVPGWTFGLTGVTVGSRVLLQIPPVLGYGKAGQATTIPADSTLYFVVDVIKAEKASATPAPSASAPAESPSAQ